MSDDKKSFLLVCIDPGVTGGLAAVLNTDGKTNLVLQPFEQDQCADLLTSLVRIVTANEGSVRIVIEQVHASPQMSPSSAFKFGANYGWWLGLVKLLLSQYPGALLMVTPQRWVWWYKKTGQLPKKSHTKKDLVNIAKTKMEEIKEGSSKSITLKTADAFLILNYVMSDNHDLQIPSQLQSVQGKGDNTVDSQKT